MERKKEICLGCKDERFIYSAHRCQPCYKRHRFNMRKAKAATLPRKPSYKKYQRVTPQKFSKRSSLEQSLDAVFSQYVRRRWADAQGRVKCFTCAHRGFVHSMDCGHWQKRRHRGTRWNLDNGRPQCRVCNGAYDGRFDLFRENLVAEIGQERVTNVERLSKTNVNFSDNELQEMLDELRKKLAELKTT